MMGDPSFIKPDEVAATLKDNVSGKMLLVDVRDADYSEVGYINGSCNIRSESLTDDKVVDELIEKQLDGKDKVIVYCMHSKKRGPAAAKRLAERLAVVGKPIPEITVMEGGFASFYDKYQGDAALVTKTDG